LLTRLLLVLAMVVMTGCGPQGAAQGGDDDGTPMPDAATEPGVDAAVTEQATPPGGTCSCDADCQDAGSHDGVCIYGICMTKASGACASGGSTTECDAGSQCWYLEGNPLALCWPECSKYTCAGKCAMDGTCEPTAQTDCDPTCGTACSCSETSCGAGNRCVNGDCVPEVGAGPGPGPGPACTSLPARDCTTGCGTLTTFSPRTTAHYDDYPINGETAANQYRSYLRRDLMMLVNYATAKTHCKSAGWTVGNGGALGLGDMSEANGAIPGTSINSPGHPSGTHTNGYDIDLAYYQLGTPDNKLRAICPHTNGSQEAYHCTADPTYLDVWRHALFLGHVFESTRTRVIGVDGKAGPQLISALDYLCDNNWLSATACGNITLAYETTNNGQGWYLHHHHHAHISLKQASFTDVMLGCESSLGCDPMVRGIPQRPAGIHRVTSKR
jgi:hypothetical protein